MSVKIISSKSSPIAVLALSASLAMAALAPAAAEDASAGADTVIATVNGHAITQRDVDLAETEIGSNLGNQSAEARRRTLVEYVIETQLMAEALEKDKSVNGNNLNSALAYFDRRARRETYFENKIKASISEAVAKTFFDDRVKGMKPEEEVKARHILVETEEEARDIAEKLNRGGDFAELAKEFSKDPGSKGNGGLLGFFSRGQMVPQFEDAAFSLKAGEVSEPVQSRFGWHLILVEEKREKPLPKFDEVKDTILYQMIYEKAQRVIQQLRAEAKIEYLDEEIKKQAAAEKQRADAQQAEIMKKIEEFKKAQDAEAAKSAGEGSGEAEKK